MTTRPKARPDQSGSKRPPKRPNAMDGYRKGDIKNKELLAGMTQAEINAAIDSGKNPKKDKPKRKRGGKDRVKKTGGGLKRLATAVSDSAKQIGTFVPGIPSAAAAAGKAASKVSKKAGGGTVCRGMGAATKGGKFRVS